MIENETEKIHKFLNKWNQDNNTFKIEEFYPIFLLEKMEKVESTDKENYYSIGEDGAGGHFVLWNYNDLNNEAPILFFGSEGEVEFIAENYKEFVYSMVDDEYSYFSSLLDDYRDFLENKKNGYNLDIEYEIGNDVTEEMVEKTWNSAIKLKKELEEKFPLSDESSSVNEKKFALYKNRLSVY